MNYVLLVGNYGNFNIGDEILLKAAVQEILKEYGPNCKFYVPTRNRDFVKTYHSELEHFLVPVRIDSPISMMKAFMKVKTIVIGGGGIWSGYTGPLAHFIPLVGIVGRILGKKLLYKAIGLYSTARSYDRFLVNLSIMTANSCTVRDTESYNQLWNQNKKKTVQVDDLSLSYLKYCKNPVYVHEYDALQRLKKRGSILIGISIKPTHNHELNEKIVESFRSALDLLNIEYKDDLHFVFFPFAKTHSQVEDDILLTDNLINSLRRKGNVTVIDHADPVGWYYAIRDLVDIFIGMRFHSIVFACHSSKPVLCIAYENKIVEFLRQRKIIGSQMVVALTPSEVSSSAISNFVKKNLAYGKTLHD